MTLFSALRRINIRTYSDEHIICICLRVLSAYIVLLFIHNEPVVLYNETCNDIAVVKQQSNVRSYCK